MNHRMIIFGAEGTLGLALVELLKKQDVDLTAASRSLKDLPGGVKGLQVDYRNPAIMEMALKEKEILFLPLPLDQDFVQNSKNILRAAQLNGVRFLLLVSSVGASAQSPYLYERLWGEWEDEVAHSKMRYCFLRMNVTMQDWFEECREELETGFLCRPEGEGRVALVDARDVAELSAKILLNPMIFHRQTLEVTGSRAYSGAEMTSLIGFHAQRRISYVAVTEEVRKSSAFVASLSPLEQELVLSRHRAIKEGRLSGVSGHYEKIMGKEARRFEDFCAEVGPELTAEDPDRKIPPWTNRKNPSPFP